MMRPSLNDEESDSVPRRWGERRAGERPSDPRREIVRPPSGTRRSACRPSLGSVPGDNEISSNQSAPRCNESAQNSGRDGKWWVRHHAERPSGKTEIHRVGNDHSDLPTGERLSQVGGPLGVELNGDDLGAAFEEGPGERSVSGADIEHEVTRMYPGVGNDLCSPAATEVMPPPTCPFPGHDAPS